MRKFILEAASIVRKEKKNSGFDRTGNDGADLEDEEECSSNDEANTSNPFQLEEALIPVSVSTFDILRMKEKIISKGCMAKAARASAGFPGLFQPVAWREAEGGEESSDENPQSNHEKSKKWGRIMSMVKEYSFLIDGGISDGLGLNGLGVSASSPGEKKRIINMVVGDLKFQGPSNIIKKMPLNLNPSSIVSIALVNTPMCGPWAMKNGPRAVESTRKAMSAMMDVPMERVAVEGAQQHQHHYLLRVDASKWLE